MLKSLFPPQVVCVEAPIGSLHEDLYPSEERSVRTAVSKRRREFATGRLCARRALARLGIENYPLLPGSDRCPRWPPGIVGCISHCADYCAVAVARAGTILSIGLDLELWEPLHSSLWPLVLNEAEISWLDRQPERGERAKLIFSAKECTYKCQFPAFGERWEFEDLEVAIDEAGRFRARVRHTSRSPRLGGSLLEGRYRLVDDRIVTSMILPEPTS